jgi:hypothetical protein
LSESRKSGGAWNRTAFMAEKYQIED